MTIISNEKETIKIPEIEKRKVAEHNDLITSIAKMDKTPLKIFELAVSFIDTENPPSDNTVHLSKSEIYNFFDVSDNDKHSRFKKAITTLHKQSIFEIREMNEKRGKYEYQVISPLEKTTWNDYSDILTIKFTSSIMPYLINLKTNFTQYALLDIMELNSKYSIILYKWLSMQYNQYEHYKNKGGRRKEQLEKYCNPEIKVSELRVITDTSLEYKRFTHFETWIIEKPLEEINKHTHFMVTYEKIKKGRNIDSIQFHITKKVQPQELNGEYKEREQDPAYLQGKKNREEQIALLSAKAMQNPFTMELLEFEILEMRNLADISLMARLQEVVYPIYSEIEKQAGIKRVREHFETIKNHRQDYSKPNIAQYLLVSARNFLASGDVIKKEKGKTKYLRAEGKVEAVNGNKIPDHRYKPAYVNETTPEEQRELERIKKEISNKISK
ncbi:MAG: RepB family plasmid replication initiator protein [Clostridia bacterium]|uniref:RepB family plasmid replication initiator protein n=1 Tax=Pseudolactococcus raffinolactis TaxID=1366 RepID=A0A6H0UFW1_9LACT|nr:RepB family plasmid replication initiator protein [Lactococcus raffinolactis]MBQ2654859.1 RepB family plasmid replication initiator protein [Methanobrevibacter sp.]MBR2787434.1 RepB family plasmid replication initiator protein [Clostridia bacterium]MBR3209898.1 RepB family plasmid replication initiator protein [Bacilli bacterium]QIW55021.1 RepB family plasmid replication initiator protein [Lactococcus raffinolactis]